MHSPSDPTIDASANENIVYDSILYIKCSHISGEKKICLLFVNNVVLIVFSTMHNAYGACGREQKKSILHFAINHKKNIIFKYDVTCGCASVIHLKGARAWKYMRVICILYMNIFFATALYT